MTVFFTEEEMAELRGDAASRLTSRVKVWRKTGEMVTNPQGFEVDEWVVPHTSLPFRLDGGSAGDGGSRTITVGGVTFEQATNVGHFPYDTTDLRDGDYLEITDGEWTGAVYRIVEATKKHDAVDRRVPLVEETRPAEWAA